MNKGRNQLVTIITLLLAVACGSLAVLWPQWHDELRAECYYYYYGVAGNQPATYSQKVCE
jgi:hypothetical protein